MLDDPFDRYTDAMAGSTTPYHGHVFRAFTDIEPGAELFVGSTGYKHDKAEAEYFHKAGRPSMEDYRLMDKIIRGLVEYKAKHPRLSEGKWIGELRHERQMPRPYVCPVTSHFTIVDIFPCGVCLRCSNRLLLSLSLYLFVARSHHIALSSYLCVCVQTFGIGSGMK